MGPKVPVYLINNPVIEKGLHIHTPEAHDKRNQITGDMMTDRAHATPGEAIQEDHRAIGIVATGHAHATSQEADLGKNKKGRRGKEMRTGHPGGMRSHQKTEQVKHFGQKETPRNIEGDNRTNGIVSSSDDMSFQDRYLATNR
jgi:hypothetical protein